MRIKNVAIAAMAATITLCACQKELTTLEQQETDAIFPTTDQEKGTVEILREVGQILEKVYEDPKAYYEVNAAIYSEFYQDESVLLKDLLFPETSKLYQTEKFKERKAEVGVFKEHFMDVLAVGEYPNLKKAMGIRENSGSGRSELLAAVKTDTSMQIFSNSAGVMIYFPYSENFGTIFTPSYFDNINSVRGSKATIVSADRDADSGPGREPYVCGTRDNPSVCYKNVTVNDAYAEVKPTHIVGVKVEPFLPILQDPPTAPQMKRVYHGWSRLTKNLDRLISFTGNGGGSEIKVARISGYLQFVDQQVTNFAGDVVSLNYTRKTINKNRWRRQYTVWDADWVANNLEQTYAVWEEDTKGTKTYTGSLGTTATAAGGTPVTANIGFNITVATQDELITQRKITRAAYFAGAKIDQGWGFQMCDDQGCRYDNTFLTSGNWPIYDGGSIFAYTWSYNTY